MLAARAPQANILDVVVVFIILFFRIEVRAKNPNHFLAKQTEFGNIFSSTTYLTEYFPSSTLKINLCTSRRTQLQHSFEIRVSFVILR